MKNKNIVALIPARAGSSRIPGKNIRDFFGHPLLAYTIVQAMESGIFSRIIVSSDSIEYLNIAEKYSAQVVRRPFPISDVLSTDFEWIEHVMAHLKKYYEIPDCFAILRPTNPFRQPKTIRRAWRQFSIHDQPCDSIRAVDKCKQHPYKMWLIRPDDNDREIMLPLSENIDTCNSPYQGLPLVYAQTAALEIAWTSNIFEHGNVSGDIVRPFYMPEYESLDINIPIDWIMAEEMCKKGLVELVKI
jgi:N-acylneuraminate cytidylyltransferase